MGYLSGISGGGGGGGMPSFDFSRGGGLLPSLGNNPYASATGFGGAVGRTPPSQQSPNPYSGTPTNGFAGNIPGGPTNLADLKDAIANGDSLSINNLASSMPMYQGIRGRDGQLLDPYTFDYSGSKGYGALKDMAFSKGPTDFYNQSAAVIDKNTAHQISDTNLASDNATGQGIGMLAQSGGIDSGQRERLADLGAQNNLMANQDVYSQAATQKGNALLQDIGLKNDALKTVTGYDVNAENLNKQAAISDLYNMNQGNLAAWGKLGDIYGSSAAADAQEALAKKKDPGFLGINGLWDSIGSFGKGYIPGRGGK